MNYTGIFQGGGIKGLAYIGALIALEEEGYICTRAAGTSIGAIFASLIISGYRGIELFNIVKKIQISDLIKKEPSSIKGLVKEKGFYSLYYIENLLNNLLRQKNQNQFANLFIDNDFILKMVATNITDRTSFIFPNDLIKYQLNPNTFPISKAAVMSSAYPVFFKPYKLSNKYITDGGIKNNFPYDVFKYKKNELVIGFVISNKIPKNLPENIQIIKLQTANIKILDFNIDKNTQINLIHQAYFDTKNQLKNLIIQD